MLVEAIVFFNCERLFSQGESNNWYFGYKAGITFNSGSPVVVFDGEMINYRSCVTVSDSLGNLLFYSDGHNVWNRNHQIMPNGTGLQAETGWDQTVNVVQKIDDDSSYYIFTMRNGWLPFVSYGGLHYSVINMRLDGGLGDIEPGQKEIQLQTNNDYPQLMVTARHQNNRDAWVIVRNLLTANNYAAFPITAAGIGTTPVISPVAAIGNPLPYGNPGTMRVSPDGTKLVYPYMDTVDYCHFNAANGQITHLFYLSTGSLPAGEIWHYMEFSRDSRFLYCSGADWSWNPCNIYQYDASMTDSTRFKQSEVLLGHLNRGVELQLAPDGKIYGTQNGKDSVCVIHNPSVAGPGCNFQKNAISLGGRNSYQGLPHLLQSYKAFILSNGQCQYDSIRFSSDIWPPTDSVHWDFGDPASGAANFSILRNPSHRYTSSGSYHVALYVRHNDHRVDTTSKTIEISPNALVDLGPDLSVCEDDSVTLDAGPWPGFSYSWENRTTGQLNISVNQTFTAKTSGTYMVTVADPNTGCFGRDSVTVTLVAKPVLTNNPLSKTICSGESTSIALSSSIPGTMFHWTASLSSGNITGLSADSGLVINQILTNNLPTAGVVTYSVTPKVGSCSGNAVDFTVTVNPGDSAKVSISASANNICAGTPVTFTAVPTNPGNTPVYQ